MGVYNVCICNTNGCVYVHVILMGVCVHFCCTCNTNRCLCTCNTNGCACNTNGCTMYSRGHKKVNVL